MVVDGTSVTLVAGFTVEQGGAPQVSVDIIGRDRIRVGRDQVYYVFVRNTGNVDSLGEFVSVAVPAAVNLEFSTDSPAVDFTKSAEYNTLSFASTSVSAGGSQVFPLLLNDSANSQFRIRLQHESSTALSGTVGPLNGPLMLGPNVSQTSSGTGPSQAPILLLLPGLYDGCQPAIKASKCPACDGKWDNIQILERSAEAADLEYQLDRSEFFAQALLDVTTFGIAKVPGWTGDVLAVLGILFNDDPSLSTLYSKMNTAKANLDNLNRLLCAAVHAYISCVNNQCGGGQTVPIPDSLDDLDFDVQPVASLDPNQKIGSKGTGGQQYTSGATPLRYGVFFGNQESASAPAQKVLITDQLDTTNNDQKTFSFGPIAFGRQLIPAPPAGQGSLATLVDLRPANNLLVAVNANLNISTGLLTWDFQSLDPATNQPPADPTVGFLPPGGEGSVFFTVRPKQGLTTNTPIQNQATIVFDANQPIGTSIWLNTIDNTPPASRVVALPPFENSIDFPVQWSGTDLGAGIQDFTVYVSDNGGAFSAFQTNTTATSATFTGQAGHTYAFYSIARDLVGNVESPKTIAEATTQTGLAFMSLTAKAEIKTSSRHPGFEMSGAFTVGAGSSPIAPDTQSVTLVLGTFSTTIPAGSFRKNRKGTYTFEFTINGANLEFSIAPAGGSSFTFHVEANGPNLAGTVNPVTVELLIGTNGGTTQVNAEID